MRQVRVAVSGFAPLVFVAVFGLATMAGRAVAQQPRGSATQPFTLPVTTQLVNVDMSVIDAHGHAVTGLVRDDFSVTDNGVAEPLRSFDAHGPAPTTQRVEADKLPSLPAGTFTDVTSVPDDQPLNVLLIDSLKTPLDSQSYLREQLADYLSQADRHTRLAAHAYAPQP